MKNNYLKEFFHRGLIFGGLGPIIAGMIYVILDKTIEGFSLSGIEVFVAIISTYLLAFVQAGASIFNQIEEWPVAKSMLFHFLSIYSAYSICYIVNSWIPFEPMVLVIFSLIFVVSYFLIWGIVYLIIKSTSGKMNKKLSA